MELSEQGLLEEFLSMRRANWDTFSAEINNLFSSPTTLDCFYENQSPILSNSFSQELSIPFEQDFSYNNSFNGASSYYNPFGDEFSMNNTIETMPFPIQEDFSNFNMVEDVEPSLLADELQDALKMEQIRSPEAPVFNVGASLGCKNRARKAEGQPSKNLMAERRRRKRLNDRLTMLRSIVPKISKMDRTTILGDTIDYMKELLERIGNLQQEIEAESNIFGNNVKPNETLVRNTPKFEVERRNVDTRIEICCSGKPGLLLSTVSTLESLGLEIENCVISCFSDFAMQASCTKNVEQRALLSSEDIKQALFRAAGYDMTQRNLQFIAFKQLSKSKHFFGQ